VLRGPSLFKEYYCNEDETAKVMTADGWFLSGDIAEIDSRGRFKIVDRVKNVLKLAQGEYVSPERLENVYLADIGPGVAGVRLRPLDAGIPGVGVWRRSGAVCAVRECGAEEDGGSDGSGGCEGGGAG